ncbi:MAG: SNF2 helicase associated domain-containing protein [Sandaracinaceae bacterium]|nr:SNF2 helicase associated domain-containing protein [Sandaracinaceae bacterium]
MAESPLIEPRSLTSISQHVARLSDRAIQRLVGGNAFLRGRLYARRNAVSELGAEGTTASAHVRGRTEEPYVVQAGLTDEGQIVSQCSCPAWKGPSGHCKHVAALLVALRDRERPPRAKPAQDGSVTNGSHSATGNGSNGGGSSPPDENAGGANSSLMPQTVSVGGKRRRSRRRRRGGANEIAGSSIAPHVEIVSPRELSQSPRSIPASERSGLDTWLSAEEQLTKSAELEYRLMVRAASITVTPVIAGTRQALPLSDALGAFNAVAASDRPLLRALARHVSRGTPATAELRGEDAAEVLGMLKGRRVLLEPASMELRFADEPLRPRLELDFAGQHDQTQRGATSASVRVRVVFELKAGSRRFPLSSGAWFEGTPGWHIDTTDGVARPVIETVTPAWLQRLYRSPALVHPVADLPRLLTDFVPRVAASLSSDLPDIASVADLVDAKASMQLKVTGDIVEAHAKLKVVYDDLEFDVPPSGFPSPLAFLPPLDAGARPRVVRRDVGAEMSAVQDLLNLGFTVDQTQQDLVVKGDQAIAFWTEGIGNLPEDWDRFIPDDLVDVTIRNSAVSPRMRVSSGVDWLSLDMSFDAGGIAVDEDELRMCLSQGRRLVKLKDGTYAAVDPSQVGQVLERMAEIVASSGGGKKLPLSQAGRVQDLLRLVGDTNITPTARDMFGKFDDIGAIDPVAKPRTLKADLRPYQKEGFSWLVFLHNAKTGGILADDMGLGKTLQTIALLCWMKAKDKEGISLVVAPTSVVPNWQREIEKFAPSLKVMLWHGPDRHDIAKQLKSADVVITSYALLRRDEEFLQTLKLRYVILDEAQHIKNPLSATARAAKKMQSERRLALTGTPIENRLSEFWSIFDFVAPNMLGSLKIFEEQYSRPIERGDLPTAQKLGNIVRPFVKRRTKREVEKDLPSKIEQDMIVPLAEEQGKLHKQMMKEIRDSLLSELDKKGIAKAQIQILAALTRLRQVACDPRLLKLPGDWNDEESGKLNALRELMSEAVAGGHRVLVFSQFVEMLKHIRNAFDADGVVYEYLDGSTQDRQARVDRFNTDMSCNAFLISLKAGGTGLNLTGADTVIHFDPWWNPAVEDQATDRAHRIGQTKVVTVYRLIAKGTVEEKILKLSAKKRSLVENVLSENAAPKGFTKADVEELFSE